MKVHEIPKILKDRRANSAVSFYQSYKRMGMPYGAWGFNPVGLCTIVDLLDPLDRYYHPHIF